MVTKFNSQDFHVINGVLASANAILKRFRHAFKVRTVAPGRAI